MLCGTQKWVASLTFGKWGSRQSKLKFSSFAKGWVVGRGVACPWISQGFMTYPEPLWCLNEVSLTMYIEQKHESFIFFQSKHTRDRHTVEWKEITCVQNQIFCPISNACSALLCNWNKTPLPAGDQDLCNTVGGHWSRTDKWIVHVPQYEEFCGPHLQIHLFSFCCLSQGLCVCGGLP